METLNWKFDGQKYSLETIYGKAIIKEVVDKTKSRIIGADKNKYLPRLELEDGSVGKPSMFREFDDFESAESFLLYNELASFSSKDDLSQTLKYCADLLSREKLNPTHLQRLNFVAKALKLPGIKIAGIPETNDPKETENIVWQEIANGYSAVTQYGTAVIIEKHGVKTRRYGSSSSYRPLIKHSTGAKLRASHFQTFQAAADWIGQTLNQLDQPRGGKIDVENVIFTLDICIKLLPEESDPIHFVRINVMGARFSDIIL